MIKAVLFDLDGTLVNSIEDLADSCNYGLQKLGLPVHETEKYKYFVGDGIPKLIERVLPDVKGDSHTYNKLFEIFSGYYQQHFADKTCAYEGILSLLKELKKQGFKVAVISNKAEVFALQVVEKTLGNIFDAVYGKCEGYLPKPDPELTLKLMENLNVKPCECVLVGDSGMDMATAVNAGCKSIGVLWGFRTKEELINNGADFTVDAPHKIIDVLREINK